MKALEFFGMDWAAFLGPVLQRKAQMPFEVGFRADCRISNHLDGLPAVIDVFDDLVDIQSIL